MSVQILKCDVCGQTVMIMDDTGMSIICCNKEMSELKPNSTDAIYEKHIPYIKLNGDRVYVRIGSEEHPMTDSHFIKWIILETNMGRYERIFKPGDIPVGIFRLNKDERPVAAYGYCNIHELWYKEAKDEKNH